MAIETVAEPDELDEEFDDGESSDIVETDDARSQLTRRVKRPPASRRLIQRRGNTVKLKADFALPIGRLARLAEEEEHEEDGSFLDPSDLDFDQPVVMPFQPDNGSDGQSTDEYLRQLQEANRIKAFIWRVPKVFAERNPLITKKPANAPGWAFQGEIPFSPESLDSDLLTLFADGFYFVEVREKGRYKAGFLKTIGNPAPPAHESAAPAPQIVVQESQPPALDPVKDAKAQILVMNGVVAAATRLLETQAMAQGTPQKQPSLKERIEEMRAMQQLFAPQQQQPAQQRDPLERLSEALESEAVKKIISAVKRDDALTAEPQTSFWDFAAQAAEVLAPGLNPLLVGLGRWLMGAAAQQQVSRPPAPTRPTQQHPQAALAGTTPPADTNEAPEEDNAVDIRFLVEDLARQAPVEETAAKINEIARTRPFVKPFLKKYLNSPNEEIWQDLLDLCESDEETAQMKQALEACTWKDEWLNNLKLAVTGGDNAKKS